MLPTGVPAVNRKQALELLEQTKRARDLEELRTQGNARLIGRGCQRTRRSPSCAGVGCARPKGKDSDRARSL